MTGEKILRRITPEGLRAIAGLLPMGKDGKRRPAPGPKFPWVGIPVPGHARPLVLSREKLQRVLQGITVDGAYVATVANGAREQVAKDREAKCGKFLREINWGGKRVFHLYCGRVQQRAGDEYGFYNPPVEYCPECLGKQDQAKLPVEGLRLRVYGSAPSHEGRRPVFTRATFLDQRDNHNSQVGAGLYNVNALARDWAEKQQAKTKTPALGVPTYQTKREQAHDRKLQEGIIKVQKQMAKHTRWGGYRPRPLFLGQEGTVRAGSYTSGQIQEELNWRREKAARRKLGWHIAHALEECKTTQQIYRTLGALGYVLQRWSDLNTDQHRGFGDQTWYWKHAYKLQGSGCTARKPHRDSLTYHSIKERYPNELHQARVMGERLQRHRESLIEHAHWLKIKREFEGQIQALEEELESFRAGIRENLGECPLCNTKLTRVEGKLYCPDCEVDRETE